MNIIIKHKNTTIELIGYEIAKSEIMQETIKVIFKEIENLYNQKK